MRGAEAEKIGKRLLPVLPGFTARKSLTCRVTDKCLLQGICFDSSGWSKTTFYPEVFVLPLFVPKQYLSFNFGFRLRDPRGLQLGWESTMPELIAHLENEVRQQAVPFFERTDTIDGFIEFVRSEREPGGYESEAIGLGLALLGDLDGARKALDQVPQNLDLSVEWQRDLATRARAFRLLIDKGGTAYLDQLRAWQDQTVKALKIDVPA